MDSNTPSDSGTPKPGLQNRITFRRRSKTSTFMSLLDPSTSAELDESGGGNPPVEDKSEHPPLMPAADASIDGSGSGSGHPQQQERINFRRRPKTTTFMSLLDPNTSNELDESGVQSVGGSGLPAVDSSADVSSLPTSAVYDPLEGFPRARTPEILPGSGPTPTPAPAAAGEPAHVRHSSTDHGSGTRGGSQRDDERYQMNSAGSLPGTRTMHRSSLLSSMEEPKPPPPPSTTNLQAELSKQLRNKYSIRAPLFDKGQGAAAGLALVSSILGSSAAAAMLTPSEVIFDRKTYRTGYCMSFGEETAPEAGTESCAQWLIVYGTMCAVSLTFNLLTLLATVSVTIGLHSWLGSAYLFFVISIHSLALALIASLWLAYTKWVAIIGTVLLITFMFCSFIFLAPGVALAWHFRAGMSLSLHLDHTGKGTTDKTKVIDGTNVMHWVAFHRNRRGRLFLSVLLAAGESPDSSPDAAEGWTPLMLAAYRDNMEVVDQLLRSNADVDREDISQGRTALHWAALKGHTEVVKRLMKAGSDPTKPDALNFTAAELAFNEGNEATGKLINEWSAKRLSETLLLATKRRKHADMQKLLASKASANSADPRGSSALHWAANRGDVTGVEILLKAKAAVNAVNHLGCTPLHEAAMALGPGSVAVVNKLLANGADPDAKTKDGTTAIQFACRKGSIEVVEALLAADVKPTKEEVDEAAKQNQQAVMKVLLGKIKDDSDCRHMLHAAALVGSSEAVQLILSSGPGDVDCAGRDGTTALHLAAQENNVDVVRALLDAKPPADVNRKAVNGWSALHWAAWEGRVKICKVLLDAGAEPNALDAKLLTPLHLAAKQAHTDVCELLIDYEADMMSQDTLGNTPAALAAQAEHWALAKRLTSAFVEHSVAAVQEMLSEARGQASEPKTCMSV